MKKIELYRDDGEHFRSVHAHLEEDKFRIETQDMGPTVEETWGDDDYEFWTTVPRKAWGELIIAMVTEFLSGDEHATDRLRDICQKHKVDHEWSQWI